MAPIANAFAKAVERAYVHEARFPIVSSVSGKAHATAQELISGLRDQLTQTVDWPAAVTTLTELGVDAVVDVGPKTILRDLVLLDHPEASAFAVMSAEGRREVVSYLTGITGDIATTSRLSEDIALQKPTPVQEREAVASMMRLIIGLPKKVHLEADDHERAVAQPFDRLTAMFDTLSAERSTEPLLSAAVIDARLVPAGKGFHETDVSHLIRRAISETVATEIIDRCLNDTFEV